MKSIDTPSRLSTTSLTEAPANDPERRKVNPITVDALGAIAIIKAIDEVFPTQRNTE